MLQARHVRAEERHGDHVRGVLDQHAGVAMVGMVVIGPWSHDNIRIPLADEPGDEPPVFNGRQQFAIMDIEHLRGDTEDLCGFPHLFGTA